MEKQLQDFQAAGRIMLYHPVKIGSVELNGNLFLAPVAGYSDRSFRSICVEQGASFTYTEMVSAEALVRGNWKTEELMSRAENEKSYAVQIFGGEEDVMYEAAKIVMEKSSCEVIDINCGCPVPKIVKTNAGSALTRDPDRLGKIVAAVKRATEGKRSVTVKIRSGWDAQTITWKEAALAALENGADAITMHPRTKTQGYEGFSDWNKLKELVQLLFLVQETFLNRKMQSVCLKKPAATVLCLPAAQWEIHLYSKKQFNFCRMENIRKFLHLNE